MVFEEKTIDSKYVFNGKLINVRVDRVTTVDGESTREIVEHADGCTIAALLPDGRMIMERQYRVPMQDVAFEAPAGKVDPGEDPEQTALRELKEETGYTAQNIEYLTHTWPSVGFSSEILYIYLCTGLTEGETNLDEHESIDIEYHHIDDLYAQVLAGKINDAKTQLAILLTKAKIDRGELDEYLGRKRRPLTLDRTL